MFSRLLAALRGTDKKPPPERNAADTAMTERAHALFDRGEHAAARDAYDQLITGTAGSAHAPGLLVNRAYCELALGETDRARESFLAALEHSPHLAQAWVGLGDIAAQRNRHDEALRNYDKAIELDASLLIARNNRAQSLIAVGRIEEAWPELETRYALPGAQALYPHRLALPRWDGGAGQRVLVHWEQGFGDIIQHLRFLPLAATQIARTAGGTCTFECPPPLRALVDRMPGAPGLVPASNLAPDLGAFDCHVPLLSLPFLLGTSADALPPAPYLRANEKRAAELRASWQGSDPRRLVGVAWRASSFDPRRSITLPALLDAFAAQAPHVRLVSLQKDIDAAEQTLLAQHGGINAGSGFENFDDTAAALCALDTVISVDTAVAHLAGALARPTLLLLNEPATARWMIGREDSPWYGTMRIVRKDVDEAWVTALRRAAFALSVAS